MQQQVPPVQVEQRTAESPQFSCHRHSGGTFQLLNRLRYPQRKLGRTLWRLHRSSSLGQGCDSGSSAVSVVTLAQGVFAQMCVAPFVAWRPWSEPLRATSEVARANHDGCVALPLAATASQRARHVHGDPDFLVSVRFRTHDGHCD